MASSSNWLPTPEEQEEFHSLGDGEDSDYSDADPEEIPDEESNTDSCEDDEEDSADFYLGKNKSTKWAKSPPPPGRNRTEDIVTEAPGVRGSACDCSTELECWELYFTPELLNKIVLHTNQKLQVFREEYKRERDCLETNVEKIRGLLGILYMAGVLKMAHTSVSNMWANDGTAPDFFRSVMRGNRFSLLLRALRFDNADDRDERKRIDKLAPIRDFFEAINDRFLELYCLDDCVTIDEMMFGFRGRCSFKQYIPSKPDRYGIKAFAIVDSRSMYTKNIEIYAGKQPAGPYYVENKAAAVVKRIAKSILGKGRNLTMDNYFSSIPLVDDLQKNHRTTVVATLRKNKAELPPEFVNVKGRQLCSTLFGYRKQQTLLSYIPKKNKNVILISSMHDRGEINEDSGSKQKPEIICYYNKTKCGVDTVDQLRAGYTVARYSCRWPLTVFFALMDVAAINAQIIISTNKQTKVNRCEFLKNLAKALVKPLGESRLKMPNLSSDLHKVIKKCFAIADEPPAPNDSSNKRLYCAFCPSRLGRRTTMKCTSCAKPICQKEHTVILCRECYENNDSCEE